VGSYRLPKKFKVPNIAIYTRLEDPIEHIENYQSHLDLHRTSDEIACRAFPLILLGNAREWFRKLPPMSISDFDALDKIFLTQFLAGLSRRKPAGCLMSLHQGPDKSLKDYIMRFNQDKLATENLTEELIFAALYQGIRNNGPLMAELARKLPYSVQEFMDKAEEFINQEETLWAMLRPDSCWVSTFEMPKKKKKVDLEESKTDLTSNRGRSLHITTSLPSMLQSPRSSCR